MKGITPVVAIILLLMITISMVGFAFIWFNSVIEEVSSNIEEGTITEMDRMNMKIGIDNVESILGIQVSVRNIGTKAIPVSQLGFYINNTAVDCTFTITDLAAGAVKECNLSVACITDEKLKIVAPGNTAIYTCS